MQAVVMVVVAVLKSQALTACTVAVYGPSAENVCRTDGMVAVKAPTGAKTSAAEMARMLGPAAVPPVVP